jgi:hypothetical protein
MVPVDKLPQRGLESGALSTQLVHAKVGPFRLVGR